MSNRLLSNMAVRVNDDLWEIVPNSLSYKMGNGETNVRAASAGSGLSVSVHSENPETALSEVKFSVHPKDDVDGKVKTAKNNTGINVIKLTEGGSRLIPVVRVFKSMSLTNDPEINPTSDGVAEFVFMGDPGTL